MSEQNTPDPEIDLGGEDDSTFSTDAVSANLAIERGLGVGAAELAAQRDPGRAPAADEPEDEADE